MTLGPTESTRGSNPNKLSPIITLILSTQLTQSSSHPTFTLINYSLKSINLRNLENLQ